MNVYINVPYSEKEQAKLLGARWDAEIRRWYYTDKQDALLFQKWFDKRVPIAQAIAPHGKISLKEFVHQVYGTQHISLTAKTARVFKIPYPLRSGWLQTYGDRLADIDRLVFKKKSKKKVSGNGGHPLNLSNSKMQAVLRTSRSTHGVETSQRVSKDEGKISCNCQVEPWEDCEHTDALAHKAFTDILNR